MEPPVAIEYSASIRRQRRFPEVETRVASLTDSCLVQQFRAAADRDSMVRDEWLQRFETAMHSLPDRQRLYSTLPRLQHYRHPRSRCARNRSDRLNTSTPRCRRRKIVPDKDSPHVTAPIVVKPLWLNFLVTQCNSRFSGNGACLRGASVCAGEWFRFGTC